VLSAHTAQALVTGPVSAPITNAENKANHTRTYEVFQTS